MTEPLSKVTTNVDFEADGKQHGSFDVPYSRNDSAWGSLRVPITAIKNGSGPTLLFTAGNHGDEYEGQIALRNLARELEPGDIAGRVIIIPALNYPAVHAGTRVSPIDGVNMNRAFPGRRDGTISAMIAHFVQTRILPLADAVIDIHSGGKTMMLTPCGVIHELPDPGLMGRTLGALLAFDAPIGLVLLELDAEGMLDTAVEEAGKIFVGTELGGGGTATVETLAIAETGVRNLLCHFGLIDAAPARRTDRGLPPTRLMHTPDGDCYVVSEEGGLYEILAELGSEVAAGDPIGRIHDLDRPERPPTVYRTKRAGTIICRHHPGLVQRGDALAVVAADYRSA